MRDIRFRGKRVDNEEWVIGYLVLDWNGDTHIIESTGFGPNNTVCSDCGCNEANSDEVIPETVGQYTGLKNKNGLEIYESDVVEWIPHPEFSETQRGIVAFKNGSFIVEFKGLNIFLASVIRRDLKVINNIYEGGEPNATT